MSTTKLPRNHYHIIDETGESLTSRIGADSDDRMRHIAKEMYPNGQTQGYKIQRHEGADTLGRGGHYVDVTW